jgi:hypothetical protein
MAIEASDLALRIGNRRNCLRQAAGYRGKRARAGKFHPAAGFAIAAALRRQATNLGQTGNLAILCGFVTAVLKLES